MLPFLKGRWILRHSFRTTYTELCLGRAAGRRGLVRRARGKATPCGVFLNSHSSDYAARKENAEPLQLVGGMPGVGARATVFRPLSRPSGGVQPVPSPHRSGLSSPETVEGKPLNDRFTKASLSCSFPLFSFPLRAVKVSVLNEVTLCGGRHFPRSASLCCNSFAHTVISWGRSKLAFSGDVNRFPCP